MNNYRNFKKAASLFFAERASTIKGLPDWYDICYISGRDFRIWKDQNLYEEMIESLVTQLGLSKNLSLLEVGCAAGFMAVGLENEVGQYIGIDIAKEAINVANRLQLNQAKFQCQDASMMNFPDNYFDRIISYNVFTNFPNLDYSSEIIREMLRVLKPNGKILIGAIPDQEKQQETQTIISQLNQKFQNQVTPIPTKSHQLNLIFWVKTKYYQIVKKVTPQITCYSFLKSDFKQLGKVLGVETQILNINKSDPYYSCRFNVVYSKANL
jgi:ubiquinone/menaquinone biosynthesis C-methylase UbiE